MRLLLPVLLLFYNKRHLTAVFCVLGQKIKAYSRGKNLAELISSSIVLKVFCCCCCLNVPLVGDGHYHNILVHITTVTTVIHQH